MIIFERGVVIFVDLCIANQSVKYGVVKRKTGSQDFISVVKNSIVGSQEIRIRIKSKLPKLYLTNKNLDLNATRDTSNQYAN